MMKKALIVSRHVMIQRGVTLLLKMLDDFELVDISKEVSEISESNQEIAPIVVILDKADDQISDAESIHQTYPNSARIALVDFASDSIDTHQQLMNAGITHIVSKRALVEEMIPILKNIATKQESYAMSGMGC